ncbi:MAG: PAS domain S-box protein [Salinivirgaceae bacterium]|nr:PAS domain S-box protein [Salinivirgaceae bacterium]
MDKNETIFNQCYNQTSENKFDESDLQWLNEGARNQTINDQGYGDVTELNTERTILNLVGKETLTVIVSDLMDLLETSVAVYEKNGDYAFGMFNSGWCQLMDSASRKLCNTNDNKIALNCGKWLCHDDCWNNSAKAAIASKKATDIDCIGGIKLYAEPIFVTNEVVGVVNIGYGNPPKDKGVLQKLAHDYHVDLETLKARANEYNPRPKFIIELAKKRLSSVAKLIGEIVARKQTEQVLKESEERLNLIINESPFPIAVADTNDEKILHWSQNAKKMFGHSPANVSEWYELAYPDSDYRKWVIDRWKPLLNEAQETKTAINKGEYQVTCKDGSIKICELYAQFIPENLVVTFNDITGRKKAELTLKESEEKLRNIFENSTNLFYSHSPEHILTYLSPQVKDMLGYTQEEARVNWTDLASDNPVNEIGFQNTVKAIETGECQPPYNLELVKKSQEKIWVEVRETPIVENGKVVSIVGSIADITERKKAEQALKESEEKYRRLTENAQDFIYRMSLPDGKYEYVSPASESLLEYTPEEFYNSHLLIAKLIHPDFKDYFENEWQKLLEGNISQTYEYKIITKTGREKWLHQRNVLIKNEKNIPVAIEGIVTDITDRKQVEEALKQSEARFRSVWEQSTEALVLSDAEGIVQAVNPAYQNLYGYSLEQLFDKSFSIIFPEEYRKSAIAQYKATFTAKDLPNSFDAVISRADGSERIVDSRATFLLENEQRTAMLSTIRDITESKNSEKQLIKAKEKAEANEEQLQQQKAEITLNNDRLESLLRVSQFRTDSIQELLDYALDEAIKLTVSKIGYIYFYNEEKRQFTLNTWSGDVMKECKVVNPQTVYDLDKTGCWGEAVRQRKTIIINNFEADNPHKKGTPKGHVKLRKFLTIPVFVEEQIVAVIGVANKENDYNEDDVRQLSLLMDSVWKISERVKLIDQLKSINEKLLISEKESKERLKELNGIYNVGLLTSNIKDLERGFKIIVNTIIPESMQFSNDVYVQLKIGDKKYVNIQKINLLDKKKCLYAPIKKQDQKIGELIVTYTRDLPFVDEHEQKLIDTIAIRISSAIESYQSEQALIESEQKFKRFFANIADAVFIYNPDNFEILEANNATSEIYGYSATELIGMSCLKFSAEVEKSKAVAKEILETGKVNVKLRHHKKKDGSDVFVELNAYKIEVSEKSVMFAVCKDITEKLKAEQALKRNEIKLIELNATKDKFFSILAHDLRSPFINILGFSDLLVKNTQKYDKDDILDCAMRINSVGKNTYKLLENLLDWSKTQSSTFETAPEDFLLEKLIIEIISLNENNAKAKEILMDYTISETLRVYADRNMIATILRNLISNAIKFTRNGGVVSVFAMQEENNIQVLVSDTGVGMSKTMLDKLFKITEKVSTPGTANEKGTGLGLILCKEFVEKHGGKIWVESELEKGSTFKFTIPCTD